MRAVRALAERCLAVQGIVFVARDEGLPLVALALIGFEIVREPDGQPLLPACGALRSRGVCAQYPVDFAAYDGRERARIPKPVSDVDPHWSIPVPHENVPLLCAPRQFRPPGPAQLLPFC